MAASLTAADILDKAADVIVANGWIQDDFYLTLGIDDQPLPTKRGVQPKDSMECPVCAGGGINVAADFIPDYDEPDGVLYNALEAFARHVEPDPERFADGAWTDPDELYGVIAEWNDIYGRTAEQVVAELRACAADLRGGAS
ncbi:MAG: hypothetical protein JWN52_6622 [Actinomycetia bacterium]|nr:hypothetical protein [Actinomycetes bacterium]